MRDAMTIDTDTLRKALDWLGAWLGPFAFDAKNRKRVAMVLAAARAHLATLEAATKKSGRVPYHEVTMSECSLCAIGEPLPHSATPTTAGKRPAATEEMLDEALALLEKLDAYLRDGGRPMVAERHVTPFLARPDVIARLRKDVTP